MRLLAIESSTELLTIALHLDGRIVEREGARGAAHSETALPLLQSLLDEQGMALAGLDGIAFGAGPGAFTGLRFACSAAQGLAVGAGLPVIGVGSLEAMALQMGDGLVYACADARMREAYCAAYRVRGEDVETIVAPVVARPDLVPQPPGPGWLGCGSGFAAYAAEIATRLGPAISRVDASARPRAAGVLRLAAPRLARGQGVDAALAAPLYVRDKVAMTTQERLAAGGSK
ncbi:MAG: tRNA threonylcarbamoyladenosine biosynthesis protein TsaB [Rhodocyclaceae bacterium]|nr:MAG: tRNA (adenosine(37)-N6)-threonylcarbamoyltransferase complex dimerization subunit type 1 TsaB [Rhodocyclaceae bacterium]MBE7421908.1 tRNA (adenosine(37)-N6)-threonylcarbamoyltransferase complex dimerization subunit type 1 TsaB [Zoogloeaceae bacterium]MBV6407971.1 tRNA threonylcarbamoyladenosine biosynthesis protein TsaB [Rhodocyclaceae bacterium]MCK6384335.1 tRNA (adenosine(37)-N6)-threonylcarbamoyltransferase complex dimerization subunit type 1 TsaB [Rhodocyclaceae bacterium]CAG0929036